MYGGPVSLYRRSTRVSLTCLFLGELPLVLMFGIRKSCTRTKGYLEDAGDVEKEEYEGGGNFGKVSQGSIRLDLALWDFFLFFSFVLF